MNWVLVHLETTTSSDHADTELKPEPNRDVDAQPVIRVVPACHHRHEIRAILS